MPKALNLLVASRSAGAIKLLASCFANAPAITVRSRLIANGHADPLYGVSPAPDVLVLRFDAEHLAELQSLASADTSQRVPLIVVGPAGNADAFRLAVRAGALDYLPEPVNAPDVVAAVERLRANIEAEAPRKAGIVTAVIGAAGGVGTSFVACNLALALAEVPDRQTALFDLDFAYAPLAGFLDLKPERGLLEALGELDSLDEHALRGYMVRHRSGLQVMGVAGDVPHLAGDVDAARVAQLLDHGSRHFDDLVIDVPHVLDANTVTALGMARHVVVVLQQSVIQLRNATRLVGFLARQAGVGRDRIRVVVNRHSRKATVEVQDVERALGIAPCCLVPSDFVDALNSIDSGIPLLEADRRSPAARALLELRDLLRGEAPRRESLLRRALPMFSRD